MGMSVTEISIALAILMIAIPVCSQRTCTYLMITPSSYNDGYIMSPGYPQQYQANICVVWIYHGQPGMQIYIRFVDVDIPSYDYCQSGDVLKIGPFAEQIYCGDSSTKYFEPYTAEMTGSYMLRVSFTSNGFGVKGRGFKLYYKFGTDITSITSVTPSTPFNQSTINYCAYEFTETKGIISTNQTVLDCLRASNYFTWRIHYPFLGESEARHEIHIKHCSMPYGDKMEVYSDAGRSNLLATYSRSYCFGSLMTSSNGAVIQYFSVGTGAYPKITLEFDMAPLSYTESSESYLESTLSSVEPTATTASRTTNQTLKPYQDFRLSTEPAIIPEYQYIGPCNYILNRDAGEIRSSNIFNAVQVSGYCTWLFQSNSEKETDVKVIFEITFQEFQLSSKSIFNVYDGANSVANVLGTRASLTHPTSLKSSSANLFIYYCPDDYLSYEGISDNFVIKYKKVVTVSCAENYLPCEYDEPLCYMKYNRCDGVWNCPLHGGDERGCSNECPVDFTCGFTGMGCYNESDKCNGRGVCPNNIDEQNCDEFHCSSSKGLFLCNNLQCVYDNLRCDGRNDCIDDSDEDDCYSYPSALVILSAVACTLICALVLVITVGCVCKTYHRRLRRYHGTSHQESPLSRQLSEMLHNRIPPPPYHEAMLTSRPYNEAHLELIDQTEELQQGFPGILNNAYQETDNRRHHPHDNLQNGWNDLDNLLLGSVIENHFTPHQHRSISSGLDQINTTLSSNSERAQHSIQHNDGSNFVATSSRDPPPYNRSDTSTSGLFCENNYHEENENVFTNNIFELNCEGQSLIQMDTISSNSDDNSIPDQAPMFSSQHDISSSSGRSARSRSQDGLSNDDDNNKDALNPSTSLSFDSSRLHLEENEEDDMQDADTIDDDSDSDCILAGNETFDDDDDDESNNSNDSDEACLLIQS